MHFLTRLVILGSAMLASATLLLADDTLNVELQLEEKLPDFEIGGQPARVHTQGLFATRQHYYITGRLETLPKRPLLIRFRRDDLNEIEFVDLLGPTERPDDDGSLDHPGGFDFDGEYFWIPVAVSRPRSQTAVVRIARQTDRPLSAAKPEVAFRVDDHLGAIAFDRESKLIFAANWDTKLIYIFRPDGSLVEQIPRERLITQDPTWALAVQDWKSLGDGRVLAGGIDKSSSRNRKLSTATVEVLDIPQRRRISQLRLETGLTREGLARVGDTLMFLPGDLGHDASILHYQCDGLPE